MHSDMINKIEKARQYAEEPERVTILGLVARFQGANKTHNVTLRDNTWICDSEFFQKHGFSPQIMALQRMLEAMLPPNARELIEGNGVAMHSDMISKIEKARQYAREPERVAISQLQVSFRGNNSSHTVTFADGTWNCDCAFFQSRGTCQHIMTVQRVLGAMLPDTAHHTTEAAPADALSV